MDGRRAEGPGPSFPGWPPMIPLGPPVGIWVHSYKSITQGGSIYYTLLGCCGLNITKHNDWFKKCHLNFIIIYSPAFFRVWAKLYRQWDECIVCNGDKLVQMIPPPPPMSPDTVEDDEALGSMLISWYMSGYHTGYYMVQLFFSPFTNISLCTCFSAPFYAFNFFLTQGLRQGRKEAAASKKSHRK